MTKTTTSKKSDPSTLKTKKSPFTKPKRAATKGKYGYKGSKQTTKAFQVPTLPYQAQNLIYQTLDPEEHVKNITRFPNMYGGSSVMPSKTIFDAQFATADNQCSVIVHPNCNGSISSTERQIVELPLIGNTATGSRIQIHAELKGTNEALYVSSPMQFGNSHVLYPINNEEVVETNDSVQTYYGLQISFTEAQRVAMLAWAGDDDFQMSFQYLAVSPSNLRSAQLTVALEPNAPGTVLTAKTDQINPGIANVVVFTKDDLYYLFRPDLLGGLAQYGRVIRIYISATVESHAYVVLTGTFVNLSGVSPFTFRSPSTHNFHYLRNLTDSDTILKQSSNYSILAQSLLCTDNTSQDQNSGMVASARIPGGRRIGGIAQQTSSPNWYQYIGSLAYNSYDGPLRNGCYSWYLGKDQNSYELRGTDSPNFTQVRDENYLAAILVGQPGAAAPSSVRIKIFTLIAFVSNSSSYAQELSPIIPNYDTALLVLGMCNSSFENGTHKQQLKKFLKDTSSMVYNKTKQLLRDPNTYKKAAQFIGEWGPIAASVLA